jgi:hypothetical protein
VANNIVASERYLYLADSIKASKLDPAAASEFVKRLLSYREDDNLFETGTQLLTYSFTLGSPSKRAAVPLVTDAETWQQLFSLGGIASQSGLVRFEGGALSLHVNDDPQAVTAADFRLRPQSAGYRAGSDGKDLGADVDLVGPGPAYERWKLTPEYQEWLQETGQLK